jgi:hypothetical protein
VVLLAALAACDSKAPEPSAASAPSTTQAAGEHAGHQGGATAPAASPAKPKELAAALEQYFAVHTLLAVRQARSVLTANGAYREAADHELEEYTEELSELVGGAYGDAQGTRFKEVWERTTADASSYAQALAAGDDAAKAKARQALLADAGAYGTWLAGASDGRVGAGDGAAQLKTHVQQLMDHDDAFAAKDYDRAYRVEREAYEHMFAAGTQLARAGVAPKAAASLDTPVEKLRTAFAMLLGEHMQLIIDAQRATFAGAPEFNAAAAQVNANTDALTKGMGAIVGPKKATTTPSGRWPGRRCAATGPGWPCTSATSSATSCPWSPSPRPSASMTSTWSTRSTPMPPSGSTRPRRARSRATARCWAWPTPWSGRSSGR